MKIRVRSIEEFENLIMGRAEYIGEESQVDTYFKLQKNELLRIRHTGKKAYLTYKKIMDRKRTIFNEIETEITSADTMKQILLELGYVIDGVVKKKRKIYRSGDITLELNRLPGIGDFVDFEIVSEDVERKKEIMKMIHNLGYSENDIDSCLYLDMVKKNV